MSDLVFSFVTSIFTIGGLFGSLVATKVIDRRGRRAAHLVCSALVAAGNFSMGLAPSVFFLLVGRFLIGFGSGIGLCVGPIFLAEIAPTKISGNIGQPIRLAFFPYLPHPGPRCSAAAWHCFRHHVYSDGRSQSRHSESLALRLCHLSIPLGCPDLLGFPHRRVSNLVTLEWATRGP